MKRLKSRDVLALHNIAAADNRIDRPSRLILAEIARTGRIAEPRQLATVGQCKAASVPGRVDRLRQCGYLPGEVTK